MDASGRLLRQPSFDLVGNPDAFGYLLVQKGAQLGLLDAQGILLLPTDFDDIQVVDEGVFSVFSAGNWQLLNAQRQPLLQAGTYQQIRKIAEGFYAFRKAEYWGLIDQSGRQVAAPQYDEIRALNPLLFEVIAGGRSGLVNADGTILLATTAQQLEVTHDSLVFYQQNGKWGGLRVNGQKLFAADYDGIRRLGQKHLVLQQQNRSEVFSLSCDRLFPIAAGEEVVAFSANYLAIRSKGMMGLLNQCGHRVLASQYEEVQPFSIAIFRVRQQGKWGLMAHADQLMLALNYDYISPLEGQLAILKSDALYGLLNFRGEIIQPPLFNRVELQEETVYAYTGVGSDARLQRFYLDEEARLTNGTASQSHYRIKVSGAAMPTATLSQTYKEQSNRLLPKFEWFYVAVDRRWGLRDRSDGSIVYPPAFSEIEVLSGLGITLVALPKTNAIELERTTFKTKLVFGLLLNEEGKLLTGLDIIDLRLEDFEQGLPTARCMFDNGKFGLIDRSGKVIKRDLAYLGAFQEGLAPVSLQGRISGSLQADSPQRLQSLEAFLGSLRTNIFLLDYTSYDQAFAREASLICENCQWGYMNPAGELVIAAVFEEVTPFQASRAVVKQQNYFGLIDKSGRFIVAPTLAAIEPLVDRRGRLVYRLEKTASGDGLLDTLGQLLLPPQFEAIGKLGEGLVPVNQNGRWGYANDRGEIIIPFDYAGAKAFSEQKAAVRAANGWTYINQQGERSHPTTFTDIGGFSEGLAWALTGQLAGYIDTSGQYVIPPVYEQAAAFFKGVAIVAQGGLYGLINRRGEWIQRPKYEQIAPFQANGIAVAKLGNDRFCLINLAGKVLSGTTYYKQIEAFSDGLALVKTANGFGFVDEAGQERIAASWSWAASFSNGRAVVKQQGRCGYIDASGKLVIPCKYTRCLDFADGRAAVFLNVHNAGLIDLDGYEVIAPNLNRMVDYKEGISLMRDYKQGYYFLNTSANSYEGFYEEARPFQHGVAAIRQGDRWGLINHKGLPLVMPKFSAIGPFQEGVATVSINKLYGLVDEKGKQLLATEYHLLEAVGEGLYRVEKGDQVGYFSVAGHWVWPLAK